MGLRGLFGPHRGGLRQDFETLAELRPTSAPQACRLTNTIFGETCLRLDARKRNLLR